jgi:hypothetical protein
MGMCLYTVLQRNKITYIVLPAPATMFYSLCTKSMSLLLTDNMEIELKDNALKQFVLKSSAISGEHMAIPGRHKGSCN